jgi:hypothetical protein
MCILKVKIHIGNPVFLQNETFLHENNNGNLLLGQETCLKQYFPVKKHLTLMERVMDKNWTLLLLFK